MIPTGKPTFMNAMQSDVDAPRLRTLCPIRENFRQGAIFPLSERAWEVVLCA